jgi:hypothetical protein
MAKCRVSGSDCVQVEPLNLNPLILCLIRVEFTSRVKNYYPYYQGANNHKE